MRPLCVLTLCMFVGSTRSGPYFEGGEVPQQAGNPPGNSTRRMLVCYLLACKRAVPLLSLPCCFDLTNRPPPRPQQRLPVVVPLRATSFPVICTMAAVRRPRLRPRSRETLLARWGGLVKGWLGGPSSYLEIERNSASRSSHPLINRPLELPWKPAGVRQSVQQFYIPHIHI